MPSIDDFIRPKEWVSDFVNQVGKELRKWGEERYLPIRREIDEDWQENKLVEPLIKEVMVDLGINSAFFPVEAGGSDMTDPMTMMCVLAEELARIDSGFATACLVSIWGLMPMMLKPHRNMDLCIEFGEKYFCRSDKLYTGCHAMTEPASGADLENVGRLGGKTIQTTAKLDGDEWVVNGHKIWPSNSKADLFIVICTTKKGSTDPNDFALIAVPGDSKGVEVGGPYKKAGMNADYNADIWFDNVRVPKRYRLHGPGDDLKYWRRAISAGNLASAAASLGVMKGVYEIIKKWTTERVIMGKPMKEHSMVAEMLNEIAVNIESTSAWMWMYAREMDYPGIYGWEPWDERFILKSRGLAYYASTVVERSCSRAMDFMGSYGYAREFDIEKHWRDQKVIGLWMGGKGLKILENARYWFELETI